MTAVVPVLNTAAAPTATIAASSATRAPRAFCARRPGCLDWSVVPRIAEAAYARAVIRGIPQTGDQVARFLPGANAPDE